MSKIIPTFLFTLLLSVYLSCEIDDSSISKNKGAVIFTFDDAWVDEWYNSRFLFEKYNIKATFFISRPQLLNSNQINKLLQLQSLGHEIACHGYNHENVLSYIDSLDVLLNKEVLPAKDILKNLGFKITAYGYPYGSSNDIIDSLLLNHFSYLRKATYNINDTTLDAYNEIFVTNIKQRVCNSMGIDYNYGITTENFETGLSRAKKNNEVLVLYAHRIDSIPADYRISEEYLEKLFKLTNQYQLQSIRTSDLEDFYGNH